MDVASKTLSACAVFPMITQEFHISPVHQAKKPRNPIISHKPMPPPH